MCFSGTGLTSVLERDSYLKYVSSCVMSCGWRAGIFFLVALGYVIVGQEV